MPTPESPLRTRAAVSLGLAAAALLSAASGLVLYLAPQGRVAYWVRWTFAGATKNQWTAVHLVFSAVLVVLSVWHLVYNLRPFLAHLRTRVRRGLSREAWVAAGVSGVLLAASFAGVPPASWLVAGSDAFKAYWAGAVGEPPIPHAELLTLGEYAVQTGRDPEDTLAALRAAGLEVAGPRQTLGEIASANTLSPSDLEAVIRRAARNPRDPASYAGSGIGREPLSAVAERIDRPLDEVLRRLAAAGIRAAPGDTLQEVAERADRPTQEVLALLLR